MSPLPENQLCVLAERSELGGANQNGALVEFGRLRARASRARASRIVLTQGPLGQTQPHARDSETRGRHTRSVSGPLVGNIDMRYPAGAPVGREPQFASAAPAPAPQEARCRRLAPRSLRPARIRVGCAEGCTRGTQRYHVLPRVTVVAPGAGRRRRRVRRETQLAVHRTPRASRMAVGPKVVAGRT